MANRNLSMSEMIGTVERLKEFIENEARSCSMDFGCITPVYVYRMWGGDVPIEDIAEGMKSVLKNYLN